MLEDDKLHFCAIPRKVAEERGISRYMDVYPCKHGHFSQRLVSTRTCVECIKVASESRRKNNAEKQREYAKKSREKKGSAALAARHKKYREDNRGRVLEYQMRYRKENPSKYTDWAARNKSKRRAYYAKARATRAKRHIAPDCELTVFVVEEAYDLCEARRELHGMNFHVDHMLPLKGEMVSGLHVAANLQVIPASMNISKRNRMIYTEPMEWLSDLKSFQMRMAV